VRSAAGEGGFAGEVLIEIVALGDSAEMKVIPDENGFFTAQNVPEGLYCYRATAFGWQAEYGLLEIDESSETSSFSITLPLDM
jgi:hypothetical protein